MDFVEVNVVDPKGIVQVHRGYWWWCQEGDPTRALFYKRGRSDAGAPQCNYDKRLAETLGARLPYGDKAKLVHIPLAFVPWKG